MITSHMFSLVYYLIKIKSLGLFVESIPNLFIAPVRPNLNELKDKEKNERRNQIIDFFPMPLNHLFGAKNLLLCTP